MQKWEYICDPLHFYADIGNKRMDALGNLGWELVSVNKDRAYFKRPVEKELDKIEPFDPSEIGKFTSVGKPLDESP